LTGALTSTVQVPVVVPSTPTVPVYSIGNGSGTAFVSGAIGLAVTGELAAGGTTSLQLSIVDQTGTLYTGAPVTVTFNSPCIASNTAEILPSVASGTATAVTTITTSSGSINATYKANGCTGADVITATATVGSQNLSATGKVTVEAATIGSIQFVSATPTTIGLKGTGLGETSTVLFKVTDSTGGPRAGAAVSFALDTSVGGISLSPATATSASDGTVQTVVSAGTVHTVVRVTATIASPALSTQSSQLTVTTGLPASAAFSIAVGPATYAGSTSTYACPNVETYDEDGVTVPFTVRLADRYNNPVPDGTAVAFYTDGGHIVGSCTTPASTSGDGTCAVTWTSANPRPTTADSPPVLADGRAQVLATAVGEESFTDDNGSGFYQAGDPFSDLGEPYLSANESANYLLGDYFIDFNQNGKWDAATGSFIGITCTGTLPSSTCTTSTLAIGQSHLIIMSTSNAIVTLIGASGGAQLTSNTIADAGLSIPVSGSGTLSVNVTDLHGNAMAAGTSISATSANTIVSVATTPSPLIVGCNSELQALNPGPTLSTGTYLAADTYPITLTAGTTAGSGVVTITVTAPGTSSVTTLSIPVTVH